MDIIDWIVENYKPSTVAFSISIFCFSIYFLIKYLNKIFAKEIEENPSVLDHFFRTCEICLKVLGFITLIVGIISFMRGDILIK